MPEGEKKEYGVIESKDKENGWQELDSIDFEAKEQYINNVFRLIDNLNSSDENNREKSFVELKWLFTKDAIIAFQDVTWGVEEIKNVEEFLLKIKNWEILIDTEYSAAEIKQYVREGRWMVELKGKWKFELKVDGPSSSRISRLCLHERYPETGN